MENPHHNMAHGDIFVLQSNSTEEMFPTKTGNPQASYSVSFIFGNFGLLLSGLVPSIIIIHVYNSAAQTSGNFFSFMRFFPQDI